jgi:hypothetical protein
MHSEQTEAINRAALEIELIRADWVPLWPTFASGIDLGAYRPKTGEFRAIQLKERMTVDRKYIGRSLWLAWPTGDEGFYWIPHDELMQEFVKATSPNSDSWQQAEGHYSLLKLSDDWLEFLEPYRLRR